MDAVDGTSTSSGRGRLGAVASIVAVGFVLPALVTAIGGGFGITRNDDYAFIDTMRTFVDHGSFEIRGPADMTLIGQVLLAWPVAKLTSTSITALQLTTLVVGTAGLLATAAFARTVVDRRRATLVAIAVAVTPMWAPLATTFMTDVWAWAFGALALAVVARATGAATTKGFVVGLVGALLAAGLAFSIRQTAVVALLAVLVGTGVGLATTRAGRPGRTTERRTAIALGLLAVVVCGGVYRWRSSLGVGGLGFDRLTAYRAAAPLVNGDQILVTIALLLLPASVVFLRRDLVVRRARACPRGAPVSAVIIGLLVGLRMAMQPIDQLTLNDYASTYGPASYTAPMDKIAIVPLVPWALLVLLAAANLWALGMVLSGPVLRRCWEDRPEVLAIAVTVIVGTIGLLALSWIGSLVRFDRYLLPLIPAGALLLAWVGALEARAEAEGPEPARAPAPLAISPVRAVGLAGFVVLAAWFGVASASFDRVVHRAGDAARRETGATVDAGLTVNYTWVLDDPDYEGITSPDRSGCWILRQAPDRSDLPGRIVAHERLLWVDRWFSVVDDPSACLPANAGG